MRWTEALDAGARMVDEISVAAANANPAADDAHANGLTAERDVDYARLFVDR